MAGRIRTGVVLALLLSALGLFPASPADANVGTITL